MIKYFITQEELKIPIEVGEMRNSSSEKRGHKNQHGIKSGFLEAHIHGAIGEYIFSKVSGIEWTRSVDTFKREPDVGEYEIRLATRENHTGELIVRPKDVMDRKYALVTGNYKVSNEFRIHGWILGELAKKEKWLKNYGGRPPAWFVPQEALNYFHFDKEEIW